VTAGRTPAPLSAWHARMLEASGIDPDTDEGQRWLAELRRYRLGEIERGQVTIFRRRDGNQETRIGCMTQLGYPGRGAWWVIGEPPLYGDSWPWVDGVASVYRTRRAGVSALVCASVRWRPDHPG
jgi:hypothetical protein